MATININDIDEKVFTQNERISKYLQGQMTKEEELAFLEDIKKDPDFKARAIAAARLAKGISDVGKEQDKDIVNAFKIANKESVMDIAKKVVADEKSTARVVSLKKGFKLISAAAAVLFIVFVGFQVLEGNRVTSIGHNNEVLLDRPSFKGGESPVADEILALNKNVVENKDLDYTIHRLEVLWRFIKAKSLEDKNEYYYEAKEDPLVEDKEDSHVVDIDYDIDYLNYAPEIGWNLAIAYLKKNEKEKAINILKEMSKIYDKDTAIGKDIVKLLDEIGQ